MSQDVPTIKKYPLQKAKILKKFISREVVLGILFFIIGIAIFLVQLEYGLKIVLLSLALIFFVAATLINYWYESKYYEKYFYNFETDFLVIRKGVFMPTETTLPWNKIQDVYLDQDLLDRVFGLWDLHVSTATIMSGYHAHIDGVSKQDAETMRDIILKTINRKKVV
jgi:membrane protein YdbS with pleckstrin-like domain